MVDGCGLSRAKITPWTVYAGHPLTLSTTMVRNNEINSNNHSGRESRVEGREPTRAARQLFALDPRPSTLDFRRVRSRLWDDPGGGRLAIVLVAITPCFSAPCICARSPGRWMTPRHWPGAYLSARDLPMRRAAGPTAFWPAISSRQCDQPRPHQPCRRNIHATGALHDNEPWATFSGSPMN